MVKKSELRQIIIEEIQQIISESAKDALEYLQRYGKITKNPNLEVMSKKYSKLTEAKQWPERSGPELIAQAKKMGLLDDKQSNTKAVKDAAQKIQNVIYNEWPTDKMFREIDAVPYIKKMLKLSGIKEAINDKEILSYYKKLKKIEDEEGYKSSKLKLNPEMDTISRFSHSGTDTTHIKNLLRKGRKINEETLDKIYNLGPTKWKKWREKNKQYKYTVEGEKINVRNNKGQLILTYDLETGKAHTNLDPENVLIF